MDFYKIARTLRRPFAVILALFMLAALVSCSMEDISEGLELAGDIIDIAGEVESPTSDVSDTTDNVTPDTEADTPDDVTPTLDEDGYYYSKDDVALYIYTYGKLPSNFITKDEAEALGWEGGSVERYLEGAAIGGDKFGNREGLLPKASGRVYYECDIDTNGKDSRGAKRIVFSNDGLIYYTPDHYESFELLYGEK